MAKTKQQKQSVMEELKAALSTMRGAVFATFNRIPVSEDWALRKALKAVNVSYRVIKKTLFRKVAHELKLAELDFKSVRGTIGMLVSSEDEVTPAKMLSQFAKGKDTINVLGGYMKVNDSIDVLDAARVKALAGLAGKQELFSVLVRTVKNPVTRLQGTLSNPLRGLVNILQGIVQSKQS